MSVQDTVLDFSAIHRGSDKASVVFPHGFGFSKEGYADIVRQAEFVGHPFLAFDAPGCGESLCADLSKVSIAFRMKAALAMVGPEVISGARAGRGRAWRSLSSPP
jgi:pimeloyl-ACP methyl ester carboxylesterase